MAITHYYHQIYEEIVINRHEKKTEDYHNKVKWSYKGV